MKTCSSWAFRGRVYNFTFFFFFLLTAMLRDGFLSCLEQCELLFSDKTNSDIFVFEIYYR